MNTNKNKTNIRYLTLTAMFAALVTVTTAFITIGDGSGYTHPGDSIVYLSATVLPFPYGILAPAIGGFFADLLAGYPQWALITAIIKALNALPFIIVNYLCNKKSYDAIGISSIESNNTKKINRSNRIVRLPIIIVLIPSGIITVLGYSIANMFMIGYEYALANIPVLCFQALVGSILFVVFGIALDGIKFKEKFLHK